MHSTKYIYRVQRSLSILRIGKSTARDRVESRSQRQPQGVKARISNSTLMRYERALNCDNAIAISPTMNYSIEGKGQEGDRTWKPGCP